MKHDCIVGFDKLMGKYIFDKFLEGILKERGMDHHTIDLFSFCPICGADNNKKVKNILLKFLPDLGVDYEKL